MNILVTGAKGFVGKNLCWALKNIRDNKDRSRPQLLIEDIYEFDVDTEESLLDLYCAKADFVFHLAGVNRPKDSAEFFKGNFGFSSRLIDCLKAKNSKAPIMLSSSIQASLIGRYGMSDYGKSKLAGEELFFSYAEESAVRVLVYRFPNLFGKWCKPNYNSVIATFCHNVANDLEITINDPNTSIEFLYIDDLVQEMLNALENKEKRCNYEGLERIDDAHGKYCCAEPTHKVSLGEIGQLLEAFKEQPATLLMPEIKNNSFEKKLYSTYLSYLPQEKIKFPLHMNADERGSFTEVIKTLSCGQISVNVSKPGVTKGQHWHNSKWEFFIVVSGRALIQQRKVGTDEKGKPYPVYNFEVSGEKMEAVHMLPGYTHNIINLSDDKELITLMWANEIFDKNHPDTFFEPVEHA